MHDELLIFRKTKLDSEKPHIIIKLKINVTARMRYQCKFANSDPISKHQDARTPYNS